MTLKYSPEFRRDLRRQKAYYTKHGAKEYADSIGIRILGACSDLKSFPENGMSAADRFEIKTDMLFLVVERFLIFYRIDQDIIEIIRLFDTRTDILFRMFGVDTDDPKSEAYWDE